MSRFYLWPLTYLKGLAAASHLGCWPWATPARSFLLKQHLPAGPGTVTMSVSLRGGSFGLPEEKGCVPGKSALHGEHVPTTEIK